jgi:NitT/TauT family transport system substrate-binding protein
MNKSKSILSLTVVLCISLFLSSCDFFKSKPKENKLTTITVGVHSWPGGGITYIADKMGYFKENGIDIQIKKIENFDTKRASLISGQIDIDVANTMDQLVIYAENNFPAQVIGVTDESVGGDGIAGKAGINSLSDLKGKTVAFAEASPSDFFLRYLLSKNGINIADIKLKPVADPQIAGNAVIAGQVDAAVTYEPYLSQAAKAKGMKLIASTKDYPTLIPGLLIANKTKIDKDTAVYRAFIDAWYKGAAYYYTHKDESYKIIAEGMGMKEADVKDILSVVDIQTKDQNKILFDKTSKDNLYELVTSIAVFWKANGFIKKSVEAEQLLNPTFIKQ